MTSTVVINQMTTRGHTLIKYYYFVRTFFFIHYFTGYKFYTCLDITCLDYCDNLSFFALLVNYPKHVSNSAFKI